MPQVKFVQIQEDDGSLSSNIPFSVEAANVILSSGKSLQQEQEDFEDQIESAVSGKMTAPATAGTSGQVLRLGSGGDPQWASVAAPTDAQVDTAVDSWLTAHPEATTTVEDGAITYAKLDSNLKGTVDDVSDLKSDTDAISKEDYAPIPFTLSAGYIKYDDGTVVSSTATSHTDFINVTAFARFKYKRKGTTGASPVDGMTFYDNNKNHISGSGLPTAGNQASTGYLPELSVVDIPQNAVYARFSAFTNAETYGDFELYGISKIATDVNNLYADVTALNDSVSDVTEIAVNSYIKKTVSGETIIIKDGGNNVPIKSYFAELEPLQDGSGDPAPDNVRDFIPYTNYTFQQNEVTNEVSFPDGVTSLSFYDIDLSNGIIHRKGSSIYDLTDADWNKSSNRYYVNIPSMQNKSGGVKGYCNILKPVMGVSDQNGTISFGNSEFSSAARIVVYDSIHTTLDSFKSYLRELSDNETPLTVVYPLATPVEYNISPVEVKTTLGENTFITNGETTITYHADLDLYLKSQEGMEKIQLYGMAENSDLSTIVNDALNRENITVVEVPSGIYQIGTTISIPDGKTLLMQGDYENTSIAPTRIYPGSADLTLVSLGNNSHFEGGLFELGTAENVTVFAIDCHARGIARTTIKKTKIVGGRETTGNHIYTQTGLLVECDYPDMETLSPYGYLMECKFDMWVDMVGCAYHFHRLTPDSSVWLTENDIYGFIRHCTRYIWYDFISNRYANNDSVIGATLQAGSLFTDEQNYPGINIWGSGVVITGMLWDFTSPHNNPAVYFEQGAIVNFVSRRGNIKDYAIENNRDSANFTIQSLSRLANYKRVYFSLYSSDNFDALDYISDLTNRSYRVGDTIYVKVQFKVTQTIPANSILFTISEDAFLDDYVYSVSKKTDGSEVGKIRIPASSPHNVIAATQITSGAAWVEINGIALSNRITTFTM